MNYKLSTKILKEIKKANRILVNCHRSPDPDAVGSALAFYQVLIRLGKEVKIVSPSDIFPDVMFLPLTEKIQKIDYATFDFGKYDLFVSLDSANISMITGKKVGEKPDIPIIVIDHHKTNDFYGTINLVDETVSSTAELLYVIFEDWGIEIDKAIAQLLLTGIIADTGVFEYQGVTSQTLGIAQKLMAKGADKNEIILNIFRTIPFSKLKFWGEIIRRMEIDEKYKFVWSAIPYSVYKDFGKPLSAKESAASMFASTVNDTDFGMIMVEERREILSISLRSRKDFDVSLVAEKLEGGGHRTAAGAKVYDLPFEKAVNKVLSVARKVVDEKKD